MNAISHCARAATLLAGLGFPETRHRDPVAAFSGGFRMRLNLAQALMCRSDLLLLDEPTNHLDLEAIEWLEGFLRLSRAGMLIVSHDRRFLEHTSDDILELQAGLGEWYPGTYSQYVRLRRERRAVRQKEYEAQQDYIARTEEFIRRYKAGQRAREARGRQTRLDRLARVAPPADDQQIRRDPCAVRQHDGGDPRIALLYLHDLGAQSDVHTPSAVGSQVELRDHRRDGPADQPVTCLDHRDGLALRSRDGGRLEPDEATADHDYRRGLGL